MIPVPLTKLPPGSSARISTTEAFTLSTSSDVDSVIGVVVGGGVGVGCSGSGVEAWAQPIIPNIKTDAKTDTSHFTITQFIHLYGNFVNPCHDHSPIP